MNECKKDEVVQVYNLSSDFYVYFTLKCYYHDITEVLQRPVFHRKLCSDNDALKLRQLLN